MKKIQKIWITVNRACNLRCKWCYAYNTGYHSQDQMSPELLKNLIAFSRDIGAEEIAFIGGEPTLYPDIAKYVSYCQACGLNAQIITNGILFAQNEFVKSLELSNISGIDVSLKGYSKQDFFEVTEKDEYDTVMKAIRNLKKSKKIPFTVSMVLGKYNIDNFLLGIQDAKNNGAEEFFLTFCHDFCTPESKYANKHEVISFVKKFEEKLNKLKEITEGKFYLHQIFPFCIWNTNILNELIENNQLISTCQIHQRNGLIFDHKGNVIPCNAMHEKILGTFGEDFIDKQSFFEFSGSETITSFYDKYQLPPDENICYNLCANWELCGGGCVSNWIHYSLKELLDCYKNI